MNIAQLLAQAETDLARAGVETAKIDAELLLGHLLNKSRTELFLAHRLELDSAVLQQFKGLLDRRLTREPLAYILGNQEFWSLSFAVSPSVLIPRPETEFMLEQVLKSKGVFQQDRDLAILDLCTGSGVIATVLARELGRRVDAVDISPAALELAAHNISQHAASVDLYCGDLFAGLPAPKKYGLIVSNPPYVRPAAIAHELEPEVAMFEPHLALDGGSADGLALIRRIRREAPTYLVSGGEIYIEFGAEQGTAMANLFADPSEGEAFTDVTIIKDYAGRDRVLSARLL